jgi:hypothetical protein
MWVQVKERLASICPVPRAHSSVPHLAPFVATINSLLADALRDRYLLERELGRGGMATVYLAQDLKHGRPLKVLHPSSRPADPPASGASPHSRRYAETETLPRAGFMLPEKAAAARASHAAV